MYTTIVIPTFNEEANVGYMIEHIRSLEFDIVVCDGHSTDRTREIAAAMGATILQRDGFGKGSAIIKAVDYALENGYDYVATIDCDRTYDYRDIPLLAEHISRYDMVANVLLQPVPMEACPPAGLKSFRWVTRPNWSY